MSTAQSVVRFIGSLKFAAVLLMVWLVAMACATVVESTKSTEQALIEFYHARWFRVLLALVAVNVVAAVVAKLPLRPRHIGFVLAHGGILVILGGALVTDQWAVRGQVGLVDGEEAEYFRIEGADVLRVVDFSNTNPGPEHGHSLVSVDLDDPAFNELKPADDPDVAPFSVGDMQVAVQRFVPDSRVEHRSIEATGMVELTYEGSTFTFGFPEIMGKAVPLGDTGHTAKVLRYLPHAVVGSDGLMSRSEQPVNPAIEIEFTGPEGTEKSYAFSEHPEFNAMHKRKQLEGLEISFKPPEQEASVVPVEPSGDARMPALLLKLTDKGESLDVWVQKYSPLEVTLGSKRYELRYANKTGPLGFRLKLNQFQIGFYPGTHRPRSFESNVTITDPIDGRVVNRVISMNAPTKYGGYSLFQSSYRPFGDKMISYLSVSRDPGLVIVFIGYGTVLVGMVVVVITRLLDRRRAAGEALATEPESLSGMTRPGHFGQVVCSPAEGS